VETSALTTRCVPCPFIVTSPRQLRLPMKKLRVKKRGTHMDEGRGPVLHQMRRDE